MEADLSYRKEYSEVVGEILRPVAAVKIINKNKEVFESLYIDSGADITLISKSVGDLLGFEPENTNNLINIGGIGAKSLPVSIKNVKMKIGGKIIDVRIAWAQVEDVPLLLGRTDVFEVFDICFKKNKKIVFNT